MPQGQSFSWRNHKLDHGSIHSGRKEEAGQLTVVLHNQHVQAAVAAPGQVMHPNSLHK